MPTNELKKVVAKCYDCPFLHVHNSLLHYSEVCTARSARGHSIEDGNNSPPHWCPLRKGHALVVLKESNK